MVNWNQREHSQAKYPGSDVLWIRISRFGRLLQVYKSHRFIVTLYYIRTNMEITYEQVTSHKTYEQVVLE